MKTIVEWKEAMTFEAKARDHMFTLDTASLGGRDKGATPKEALIASILGCSGMDIVALLKKERIELKSFSMSGNAEARDTHPRIFPQIDVVFDLRVEMKNPETDLPKVVGAVALSMTKYCGVSAMVAPTSPIFYTVLVNGEIEARDQAHFPPEPPSKS